MTLGKRRGTLDRSSVNQKADIKRQTTPTGNLESPMTITYMFLDCVLDCGRNKA